MKKNWVIKKPGDYEKVNHLAQALNVDHNIANLLVQRGIISFDDARDFFRPTLTQLFDPFLMKDMASLIWA